MAVAAVLYPMSSFTFAQAPAADSALQEEIIVTATRRELNLQSVAQSISALSTADIEKLQLEDMEDVIGALPSVNLVNAQPGRNSVIMRGVSTGSAEYRTDSQVAVYLDEQPMTSISQQVDVRLIDIARVESLPGPQGTLFGSSSQSGTLRYITNKPDPTGGFASQINMEAGVIKGGTEDYDVSGYLNIPLTDALAFRAVGFYSKEGGYVDNVVGLSYRKDQDNAAVTEEDFNDYEVYGGRLQGRWIINPQWESTLSLITQYSRADGSWDSDPALGDYKVTRFFDEYRDDDWYQASMSIKGDLGFAELAVTGSYFDRDIAYEWDNMLYDQWRSYTTGIALYDTGYTFGTTYNWQKQNRWAYEVRLTSLGESRFQWMLGGFYEDVYDWWDYGTLNHDYVQASIDSYEFDSWDAAQYYACVSEVVGAACPLAETDYYYSNIYDKSIKQKAVFGEMTFALTKNWSVTGGARWFQYDRREFDTYETPRGLPAFLNPANPSGKLAREGTDEDVVLKLGTEYHFDDRRMAYLLFSQGFRLGGNNSERAAGTGLIPLEYKPDKLNNYELGLKSKWLDDRLLLNVALFYMQWDDIQVNEQASPFWLRGTFNAGKAEQKGIELNGSINFTRDFSFEASVFLADPEFTDDITFLDDTVLPAGSTMPVSPKEKYWAAINYTFPDFIPTPGNLWTRFSYSYQGETWKNITAIQDNNRDQLIEPWSSGTFQLGFSAESGWDLALVVRNVFDEHHINWLSNSDYSNPGSAGLPPDPRFRYTRTLQKPRTIGLSFTKKW